MLNVLKQFNVKMSIPNLCNFILTWIYKSDLIQRLFSLQRSVTVPDLYSRRPGHRPLVKVFCGNV